MGCTSSADADRVGGSSINSHGPPSSFKSDPAFGSKRGPTEQSIMKQRGAHTVAEVLLEANATQRCGHPAVAFVSLLPVLG
jgi:hypothetical protein